jgi:hypothetical protein
MRYLVFFLFLTSCAIDQTIEYKVNPDLMQFVDKFFQEADKRGVVLPRQNLVVTLHNNLEKMGALGRSKRIGEQRVVLIDYDYFQFNTANGYPLRNEALVFHELGHALLNQEHRNSKSIMNANSCYYSYCYDGNSELIDELFSH